jgi:hypothetical protein
MLLCVIISCPFCFGLTILQAKREPVPGWATGFNWERPGVADAVVRYMLISCPFYFRLTFIQVKREPVPGWATGFNWERPGVVDAAVRYELTFICLVQD